MLYFRALGTLEVQGGDGLAEPPTPKVAAVLALLLCRHDQVVNTSAIMEELWGDDAPKTANATTQTYVYKLRKFLHTIDRDDVGLVTRQPGYVLHVGRQQLDVLEFSMLADEGRSLFHEKRYEEATMCLRKASSLWRGPAFGSVAGGQIVHANVAHLNETLMQIREMRIQAEFLLGRHKDTIGELTALVAMHPLNEWIYGRLIQALSWSGRRVGRAPGLRPPAPQPGRGAGHRPLTRPPASRDRGARRHDDGLARRPAARAPGVAAERPVRRPRVIARNRVRHRGRWVAPTGTRRRHPRPTRPARRRAQSAPASRAVWTVG